MSCCKECAAKGPEVTCSPCEASARAQRSPWASRQIGNPNDAGGAWSQPGWQVGALTVSAEERNAMAAQVLQFTTDVDAAEAKESATRATLIAGNAARAACAAAGLTWNSTDSLCVQQPDPTGASYADVLPPDAFMLRTFRTNRLTPFLVEWEQFLTSALASIGVARFEELKVHFATLINDWKGLGQATSAVAPPVAAPNAFDSFSNSLAAIAGALPWVALGTGVLVAGWFLWPVVAPAIGVRLAGR